MASSSDTFIVRPASLADLDAVLDVLDDAAGWLSERSITQWPPHFPVRWLEGVLLPGNTWLILDGEEAIATVTVTTADPLWNDNEPARYLHRLAVNRRGQGLGARVLAWVEDEARAVGVAWIRLDCVSSNRDLCDYYERAGFEHCGDRRHIPLLLDDKASTKAPPPTPLVSRYQRRVPPTPIDNRPGFGPPPVRPPTQALSRAWPARVTEACENWTLRWTDGITKRANSALIAPGHPNPEAGIDAAEAFYARHNAQPVFMVHGEQTDQPTIDALARRGYQPGVPTWLLATTTADALAALSARAPERSWQVSTTSSAADEWMKLYLASRADPDPQQAEAVLRDELLNPSDPAWFTTVYDESQQPAAVGQLVRADRWGCIQCLTTAPTARRRGLAAFVVQQLCIQAADVGATSIFAAVEGDNRASLELFTRAGFVPARRYRYFTQA